MNPPGGISLVIHIFIVIFGAIRRQAIYALRRIGFADSKAGIFMKHHSKVLKNTFVERSISLVIVAVILAIISLTVFMSVRGAVEHQSNVSFISGLVIFLKSVL